MVWVNNAAKRADQLRHIKDVIEQLEVQLRGCDRCLKELSLLYSVSRGLYDELEVLVKNWPLEPVSPLLLGQVNQLMCDAKLFLEHDLYVQKLEPLAAFEHGPQQRDVLIVLRQARQGLARYQADLVPRRALIL